MGVNSSQSCFVAIRDGRFPWGIANPARVDPEIDAH
jgi:hypothetical protein